MSQDRPTLTLGRQLEGEPNERQRNRVDQRCLDGHRERAREDLRGGRSRLLGQQRWLRSERRLRRAFASVVDGSEGIAEEVKGAGVTVTAHCPGAAATNFAGTAGNDMSILFKLGAAPADKIARHAYRSMMKGKVVSIEGLMNWLAAFSIRFSPQALVRKMTRWMNQT